MPYVQHCAQGIALSADRNYKVLGSAYPWIARRLLSDRSAELQDTLHLLLYKGGKFQFRRMESLLRQAVKSPPRRDINVQSATRPNAAISPGALPALPPLPLLCLLWGLKLGRRLLLRPDCTCSLSVRQQFWACCMAHAEQRKI
jgi:hypothetical protein